MALPPLLLPLLLLLPACGNDEPTSRGVAVEDGMPTQTMSNAVMRQSSVRGLLWVLKAERAYKYEEDDPTELETLFIEFYDGTKEVKSTLTSKAGWIDPDSQSLVAEGNVVVVTEEGERLETERLEWDPKTENVRTDLPFVLYRAEDKVTGIGIVASPDLGTYTVSKDFKAVVLDPPDLEEIDNP